MYERERERDARRLLLAACGVELDRALERRVAHVEAHRERMISDAKADMDSARERLIAKLNEIPDLRAELIGARETLEWIANFSAQPENFGFVTAACLGLRQPVEAALGTKARVEWTSLLGVLAEDAAALASRFSQATAEALGIGKVPTPLDRAMWSSDPAHQAWARKELERARELGRFGDPHRLADEVRESLHD